MRKVALRGLFARKTRLILTSLAVALGVMLISGTYVFTDTINASFEKIFTGAYKNVDVAVTPNDDLEADESGTLQPVPASVVGQVRKLPEVADVDGSIFDQGAAVLDAKGDPISKGAPNFVASIHEVQRFRSFEVADGRLPRGPDEVALDKATAKRKHFKVGGTVDIVDAAPKKTFRVVGLVSFNGIDSFGGAAVALMTLPEAQRMAGKVGKYDEVDVSAKPGVSREQLRAAVRRALPARYDVRTGTQAAAKETSDIKDNLGFLTTALLAFAAISLFVGAFIIFNTFSITVVQRSREFALLRTLGARRAQVLRSVLTEGFALGTLGSVAGIVLGILVAKGLKAMFYAVGFDLPSEGTIVKSRTIIVALLVGVLVTMIASLAPALRATRVPPVAALQEGVALGGRDEVRSSRWTFPISVVLTIVGAALLVFGITASDATTGLSLTGGGAVATFLGVGLMSSKLVVPIASVVGRPFRGVTGRLARENAIRQPGRTASTAAALMIGVALVSFASIFAASAKETVSGFIDRGMASQLVVQNQDGFTPFSGDARRELDRVPGVETTAAIRFAQVRVGTKKEGITGVDPETWNHVYNVTKGGDVIGRLKRGEAAVSKTYAEDHGLHAGSTLTVRTIIEPRLALRVVGIYEDKASLLGKITLPNDAVARDAGVSRDAYVFVKYRPGADADATRAAIKRVLARDFPQTEALTADEFKNDQADQLNQLLGMIYALLALSIIVSLFGIVNTLALAIAERTRELGMLRAIGTSRRQVKSMIRKESVIIATIGGVLGLALGIVLSILFTQALDDFVLHVPVVSLFILLFLSALAGLAAAALPARRAARLNVLEALAYE